MDPGDLDLQFLVTDLPLRGRVRHRLAVILSVALAAVCAGARSFTTVAESVHDVPVDVLDRLGIEGRPPSESTIRRTLGRVDATVLDQIIGVWAWLRTRVVDSRRVIAADGRRCGARRTRPDI